MATGDVQARRGLAETHKKKKPVEGTGFFGRLRGQAPFGLGGREGNRTRDLLTASQALSQLSYTPKFRTVLIAARVQLVDRFFVGEPLPDVEARAGGGRPRDQGDFAQRKPIAWLYVSGSVFHRYDGRDQSASEPR